MPTAEEAQKDSLTILRRDVAALIQKPPSSAAEFRQRWHCIRETIQSLESSSGSDFIECLESEFRPLQSVYDTIVPDPVGRSGDSVYANDYRFFVGGLEAYVTKREELGSRQDAAGSA